MIRQQAKITNRGNVHNQEEYMQNKRMAQNAEQSAVRFIKYLSKDTIFFLPLYTTTVSLKWNMVWLNCRLSEPFLYVVPHFKGFGWIKFLWSLWLSEVKSPWTSLNAVFPLLGCSARSSAAAYLWAFLHSVVFNNWKACAVGLRSHDSVGYWKEPTSFPWETLAFAVSFGSLPICTLKCCPSSFQDLKAEQRVQPCALHNTSCYFYQQSHYQYVLVT